MEKKQIIRLVGGAMILFIALPALVLIDPMYQPWWVQILVIMNLLCTWLFFLVFYTVLDPQFNKVWPKRILSGLAAFYYLFLSFEVFYKIHTGMYFDIFFFLDSFHEVFEVIINVFGPVKFLFFLGLFIGLGLVYYAFFKSKFALAHQTLCERYSRIQTALFTMGLFALVLIIPSANGSLSPDYFYEMAEARKQVEFLYEDVSEYTHANGESVFMLQLESGNGLLLNGDIEVEGEYYKGPFMPTIHKVFEKGIFFPYFLGQSPLTNRGQVNILCSLTNNIGTGLTYTPEDIPTTCLPELLKKLGYTTIAFRSSDLKFSNTGGFFEHVGFEKVYNKEIMKDGDPEYEWGYDDCVFYDRAYEYLEKHYSPEDKLFVYFEVSSHHYPFDPPMDYEEYFPFSVERGEDNTFSKKYLNSFSMQDHCVGRFYENYQKFTQNDAHLFVLPDHSWPVGLHGNNQNGKGVTNDNMTIFLGYMPPVSRSEEFNVGKEIVDVSPGQTDIVPTVFDLLGHGQQGNSFGWMLRGEKQPSTYEQCHIQIQPYSGAEIAVVTPDSKHVYSIHHKTLVEVDRVRDFWEFEPALIAEDYSYQNFRDTVYCKRYSNLLK